MEKLTSRKGFLFVVTVFLFLTYVLLSISVWVKSIEASERAYSEFYKESNVELAIEQITEEKVGEASKRVLSRGILVISDHSVDNPLKKGPLGDEDYSEIEYAINEWLVNGTPDQSHFMKNDAPSEPGSSMQAWAENLNSSLSAIGVYVDTFNIYDFTLNQTTYDAVDYSFKMDLVIRDISGATSIVRTYEIEDSLNISGMTDAGIMRETDDKIDSRRVFFDPKYTSPSSLKPVSLGNGDEGQGWFYGYLVNASDAASVSAGERERYILVGSYSEITAISGFRDFGAFIVTSSPGAGSICDSKVGQTATFNPIKYEGVNCDPVMSVDQTDGQFILKPFIVAPGFDISAMPDCPEFNASKDMPDRKCVLFVTERDPVSDPIEKKLGSKSNLVFYDIEAMRDVILCGLYVNNPKAPSYLQRMFNDTYELESQHGIETFIIGKYALDSIGSSTDTGSNIDREQFNNPSDPAVFIRGMPGCKDAVMCGNPDTPTGRFGMSTEAIKDYVLGGISCNNNDLAGCK